MSIPGPTLNDYVIGGDIGALNYYPIDDVTSDNPRFSTGVTPLGSPGVTGPPSDIYVSGASVTSSLTYDISPFASEESAGVAGSAPALGYWNPGLEGFISGNQAGPIISDLPSGLPPTSLPVNTPRTPGLSYLNRGGLSAQNQVSTPPPLPAQLALPLVPFPVAAPSVGAIYRVNPDISLTGYDLVYGYVSSNDSITGTGGNDTIYGGSGGENQIVGGPAGGSLIYGGGNGDTLIGGGGSNNTIYGGPGNETLYGGAGNDVQAGTPGSGAVYTTSPVAGNNLLVAGAGNDILFGDTSGHNTLVAGSGNDTLYAGTGGDYLDGGTGVVAMYGGSGSDTFQLHFTSAPQQPDTIVGSASDTLLIEPDLVAGTPDSVSANGQAESTAPGDYKIFLTTVAGTTDEYQATLYNLDALQNGETPAEAQVGQILFIVPTANVDVVLKGGTGNTWIQVDPSVTLNVVMYGGPGQNTLIGGGGNDIIYGGTGPNSHNTIYGGTGNDLIYGGPNGDLLFGGVGNESIYGGSGNDTIYGGTGNQLLDGGDGNNFIYGGTGQQTLVGGNGDDYFQTGIGNEVIEGGAVGNNLLVQTANANQTLTSSTLSGLGNDVYSNIQQISLTGGASPHTFDVSGFTGAVTLTSVNGNDSVASTADTDFTLSDGRLSESNGANIDLVNITTANLTALSPDDTFDVSNWTGTGTLTGGTLLSYSDGNQALTDTSLVRADGGDFTLANITAADLTAGPGSIQLDASGFSGTVYLYSGTGHDELIAGSGNTVLVGTAGAGDTLIGGDGNDTIYGSQGADSIIGGSGSDVIYGGTAPGSFISGGTGADTIVGGANDDTIYGNGGADVLIAGGTNDLIYADNPAGTGDTGAVSYLYGTYAGEPGAGTDILVGGKGNDNLFGDGDTIVSGSVGSIVDNALASNPAPSAEPLPTGNLPQLAMPGGTATLPTGVAYQGLWTEISGSASGGGLSNSSGQAETPSIVAGPDGTYVAWSDSRSGVYQIDVAELKDNGWESLGSLAVGGAIVATTGAALNPSITLGANGQPIVAWTEVNGTASDILVAQYDPTANGGAGGWDALGNSLATGGISQTGLADDAQLVETSTGPVVAYIDRSSGSANVYVQQFVDGQWQSLGSGAASGAGVFGSSVDVQGLTIATDGTDIAIAWSQPVGSTSQIYLLQYSDGTWNSLGGSATGHGLSSSVNHAMSPTLAYNNGTLFAAWQDNSSGADENLRREVERHRLGGRRHRRCQRRWSIELRRHGQLSQLAAGDGQLYLLWLDNRILNFTGNTIALYAEAWNGNAFVQQVPGEASFRGVGNASDAPTAPAPAVDASGQPFVAWQDSSSGADQIYLWTDSFRPEHNAAHPLRQRGRSEEWVRCATSPASPANNGLAANTPKDSVADVLSEKFLEQPRPARRRRLPLTQALIATAST